MWRAERLFEFIEFDTAQACQFFSCVVCCRALFLAVSRAHNLPTAQVFTAQQIFFSRGHDPSTHVHRARLLTEVGEPFVSVSLSLSVGCGSRNPGALDFLVLSVSWTDSSTCQGFAGNLVPIELLLKPVWLKITHPNRRRPLSGLPCF